MNIFNDSKSIVSVGERLQNIQDATLTTDSVAVLQSNDSVVAKPISTYAQNTLLGLTSDADIQTIANNASPVSYSTIYTENISKLTQGDMNVNLRVLDENPVSQTDSYKTSLTFWGTFYGHSGDGGARAASKIQSGFYSPDNNWGGQELQFYVGGGTYDNGNSQNFPGANSSSLRFQIADTIITTSLTIRPSLNNTYDLGTDAGDTTNNTETTDRWFRNAFISNIYHNNSIQVSDERLKTDIEPLASSLSTILKIKTKQYRYRNDPSKIRFGMIAQQIQTLFSDSYGIVNERNGGVLGLNYIEFIPLIIKSIQELARNRSKNIPDDVNVVELEVKRENPKDNNMFGSLMDRLMKLEKLITTGANIVESVEEVITSGNEIIENDKLDDIVSRLEKLESKHSHSDSDGESDGFDVLGKVQHELYESNQRISKIENKLKKITTLVNKIAKG